jgi:glutamine amidotransferase
MITVIDYGMGNHQSVVHRFRQLGVSCSLCATPEGILQASKIVLPGVGHFARAMENLQNLGMIDPLNEAVLIRKVPVLGICLGMQLMCSVSAEGNAKGLGWFDAEVNRLVVHDSLRYKVPHTGWSEITWTSLHPLVEDIPNGSEMYFVHAYGVLSAPKSITLTETVYENAFVSGLARDHIFGVQFHPEKSHNVGKQMLANFIKI